MPIRRSLWGMIVVAAIGPAGWGCREATPHRVSQGASTTAHDAAAVNWQTKLVDGAVAWTGDSNPVSAGREPCDLPDRLSPLAYRAFAGELEEVRSMLHAGTDPDQRNAGGPTPLMMAIAPFISEPGAPRAREEARQRRKYALVDVLLRAGADVTVTDGCGATALHQAASMSSREPIVLATIARLLRAGAVVDAPTNRGLTPLFYAVYAGRVNVAKALLEAGADPAAVSVKGTPLALAEQRGDPAMVAALNGAAAARSDPAMRRARAHSGPERADPRRPPSSPGNNPAVLAKPR